MDRVSEQQEWNMCNHTQPVAVRSSLHIIYQTITEVRLSFTLPVTLPPGKCPHYPLNVGIRGDMFIMENKKKMC
jgi:hypothetical protein